MNTAEILALLRRYYRPPAWAFFLELRAGTGYNYNRLAWMKGSDRQNVERRLDAWAFHLWPSGGYRPTGFEVKVSRADFLHDVKTASKRARYLALCQYFYYVTPKDLVRPDEVPPEAGLMYATTSRLKVVKFPPERTIPQPEWDFFAAICRRVLREETERVGVPDVLTLEEVDGVPSRLQLSK